MGDVNCIRKQEIEMNDGFNMKSLRSFEHELLFEERQILCQIDEEKYQYSLLNAELESRQKSIEENYSEMNKNKAELQKLQCRHQTTEFEIENLNQMNNMLRSVLAEEIKKLESTKFKREKMRNHQQTVLDTYRQKWQAYSNFYNSMPEAQNYLRLKSELVIAEEELKSLKKLRQELEEETKSLYKESNKETRNIIFKIATLKCETIRIEKKVIHEFAKANKQNPSTSKYRDDITNKTSCTLTCTTSQNQKEIPDKRPVSYNYRLASHFSKSRLNSFFRNTFTTTPLIRPPENEKQIELPSTIIRNNDDMLQNMQSVIPVAVSPPPTRQPEKEMIRGKVPLTQSDASSSEVASQNFSLNINSPEDNAFSLFGPPIDNVTASNFAFDFNAKPSTSGFQMNFEDETTNFNFGRENFGFQETPEDRNASSGFRLSIFD